MRCACRDPIIRDDTKIGPDSMAEYIEQVSQFCPAPEEAAGAADEIQQ